MKRILTLSLFTLAFAAFAADKPAGDGWISLFDGKSLDGWRASDKPGTFSVEDGKIVVHGPRSHLFYVGPVHNHDFKNFHLRAELMTFPGANSGIYFHTDWQEAGWPDKGFEVQVNNTHKDPKKTAGLYDVKDNFEAPAKDNEWFTMEIIVEGKHVVTKVNGKVIIDWTQPDDFTSPKGHPSRIISHGTFAIQGHDPGSKIYYKSIEVKPLP
jgi:3-keto-disaccharide hydrolase